jgi:hypothetical protein
VLLRVTATPGFVRVVDSCSPGLGARVAPGQLVSLFDADDLPADLEASVVLVIHEEDAPGGTAWLGTPDGHHRRGYYVERGSVFALCGRVELPDESGGAEVVMLPA